MLDSSEPVRPGGPVEGDLAQQRADERQQPDLEDQRAEGDGRVERARTPGARGSCQASRYIRWSRRERLTPDRSSSSTLSTPMLASPDGANTVCTAFAESPVSANLRTMASARLVVLRGEQRRGEDDERDQGGERLGRDDGRAVDALDGEEAAQAATREPLLVQHVRQPHRLSCSLLRGCLAPGTARARTRAVDPAGRGAGDPTQSATTGRRAPHLARVTPAADAPPPEAEGESPRRGEAAEGRAAYQWEHPNHREGGHPNDHHTRRTRADRLRPAGVPERATDGSAAEALLDLVEAGTIRLLDLVVARKEPNGTVEVIDVDAAGDVQPSCSSRGPDRASSARTTCRRPAAPWRQEPPRR